MATKVLEDYAVVLWMETEHSSKIEDLSAELHCVTPQKIIILMEDKIFCT
jgi:hypothetical protein